MDTAWPLVERQRQLRRIADAVRDPACPALLVAGPAGVGKTSLAREALRQADRQGVPTRWVVATRAAASLPFGAVAHLLPDGVQGGGRGIDLLSDTRRSLVQLAEGRRVVVGVDDAHLLDDASATLLHHLAIADAAFLLCTVRTGLPVPDPVAALRSGEDRVLDLDVLSEAGVADALTRALGGQVDGEAVHRLARLSGGNALLLRELVADARQRGALVRSAAIWRVQGDWAPGRRLPDLVRARLDVLSPAAREILTALALGEPLEAELLERMVGAAPPVAGSPAGSGVGAGAAAEAGPLAAEGLREAEDAGLLEALPETRRQRLRLVHPLYAEALRAAVSPLRTRVLHRLLADALEATGARRRGDSLRLGAWRLASGDAGDAATFLSASWQAAALGDHPLAERLARAAQQVGGGFGAKLALAHALRWQGRGAEVDAVLADWAGEAATDAQRALAATLHDRGSDTDERLRKAEALVVERGAADILVATRADAALGNWRVPEALALAWPLVADPQTAPAALIHASEVVLAAFALQGRGDEGLAIAAHALALLARGESARASLSEVGLRQWSCVAHGLAGRIAEARAIADERYAEALARRAAELQAWWAVARGHVALLGGRVAEAVRRLREALALIEAHPGADGGLVVVFALSNLAQAAALGGDLPAAEAALDAADRQRPIAVSVTHRELARAWVDAARADLPAARESALGAAAAARADGLHAVEALALHTAVRLGLAGAELEGAAARLAVLAPAMDGRAGGCYAHHAAALRDADGAGLDAAAAGFAALGLLLEAAEAATQAAVAHRTAGRAGLAQAAARRARELAASCEGARSPALALGAGPVELSPRETEIARLAARGLPNREIAERLVVSVRTVDNHLHRVYAKLQITGRDDLATALGE